MVELDKINKTILEELQKDARISFRKIAKKAGVSEAAIFLRVRKLQEEGIILGFTTLVSPEKTGKGLAAFILIRGEPQKLPEILNALSKIDGICELHDVTGNYYAIAKIRTGSREELTIILDAIGSIQGIISTETAIVLKSLKEDTRIKL